MWIPTDQYKDITSKDPVKCGEKSFAFVVPPEYCDSPKGIPVKASIQAAFMRPDWTLLFLDHNVMIQFHIMRLRGPFSPQNIKPESAVSNTIKYSFIPF